MDIDNLQNEILEGDNLQRLYKIQIDLSRLIANTHRQILLAETTMEQSEAKGILGIYHSMQEVLLSRVSELKEKFFDETNENRRIDHNFRTACKDTLHKDTYNKIMNLAILRRKEVKVKQKELRQHKLE